jgi:hypothetical protein
MLKGNSLSPNRTRCTGAHVLAVFSSSLCCQCISECRILCKKAEGNEKSRIHIIRQLVFMTFRGPVQTIKNDIVFIVNVSRFGPNVHHWMIWLRLPNSQPPATLPFPYFFLRAEQKHGRPNAAGHDRQKAAISIHKYYEISTKSCVVTAPLIFSEKMVPLPNWVCIHIK